MGHVPWVIHVFPHVIESDSCKSCFLLRYHHALVDGVNIMRLLLKYTGKQDMKTDINIKTKSQSNAESRSPDEQSIPEAHRVSNNGYSNSRSEAIEEGRLYC